MKEETKEEYDIVFKEFYTIVETRNYEVIDEYITKFIEDNKSARLGVALLTIAHQEQRNLKKHADLLAHTRKKYEEYGKLTDVQINAILHGFDKAPDSLLLWKNGVPYSKKIEK